MKDYIQLNRLSIKCLDVLSSVSKIYDISKDIAKNPIQENIDKLTLLVNEFQDSSSQINECLISLIKEISQQGEEIETDAIETDVGYKL